MLSVHGRSASIESSPVPPPRFTHIGAPSVSIFATNASVPPELVRFVPKILTLLPLKLPDTKRYPSSLRTISVRVSIQAPHHFIVQRTLPTTLLFDKNISLAPELVYGVPNISVFEPSKFQPTTKLPSESISPEVTLSSPVPPILYTIGDGVVKYGSGFPSGSSFARKISWLPELVSICPKILTLVSLKYPVLRVFQSESKLADWV